MHQRKKIVALLVAVLLMARCIVPAAVEAAPKVLMEDPLHVGKTSIAYTVYDVSNGDEVRVYDPRNRLIEERTITRAISEREYIINTNVISGTYRIELDSEGDTFYDEVRVSAYSNVIDSRESELLLLDKEVDIDTDADVKVTLRDKDGDVVPSSSSDYRIYVWAESTGGSTTPALTAVKYDGRSATHEGKNVYRIRVDAVSELQVRFDRSGSYRVYASLADPNVELRSGEVEYADNTPYGDVRVFAHTSDRLRVGGGYIGSARIGITPLTGTSVNEQILRDGDTYDRRTIEINPNSTVDTKLRLTVYDQNNRAVGAGEWVRFDNSGTAVNVSPAAEKTDKNGQVEVTLTSSVEGSYKLYITTSETEVILPVKVVASATPPAPETPAKNVVMVVGSEDTFVNGNLVRIDTPPVVTADWRTFVPFRALAESFGADVVWDNDKRTVTATLDGITVVMTVDQKTYTVNGTTKTMDTAPYITNSRTMVPIRFMAEAYGFKVTPIFGADGTTASVSFAK